MPAAAHDVRAVLARQRAYRRFDLHIVAPFQLSIRFFDGHTFEAAWENKRKMPKHTEQRKQHMREVMIQKWREKCGESNDYTGDDKPVHGNADQ